MSKRLYLVLAILAAILLPLGIVLSTCSAPTVPPAPLPAAMPAATSAATSSAAATATGTVRAIIRRPVAGPHAPQTGSKNLHNGPETLSGSAGPHAQDYEEIVIEVTQSATTAASSEASASAQPVSNPYKFDHARLGLAILTAPGILALDYQLLRIDASPLSRPALGVDLELGLDVAGNAQVAAMGVTAGGKTFAGMWAWSRWDLEAQGLAAGVGLRF